MTISVVIPTKDRQQMLEHVIPIYLRQPEVTEIVVVVDGSVDGSLPYLQDVASRDGRLRVFENPQNMGVPYAKNRAIDLATSEYIFTGEDDLEVTDGFFATLLAHKEELGVDVICGRNIWRWYDESIEDAVGRADAIPGPYVRKASIEIQTGYGEGGDRKELMLAQPMLAKATVFRAIKFDEALKVNYWREESDFQFSAQEAGLSLGMCPHAVCFNYMIRDDRGGVHAAIGLRRVRWVIANNWYFVRKHEAFISENFSIGNPRIYIVRFAMKRVLIDLLPSRALRMCQSIARKLRRREQA